MTEEEIEKAKDYISYCITMSSEAESVEGLTLAIKLIEYYENELSRYMRIATVYDDFFILSSKIKAEANKK